MTGRTAQSAGLGLVANGAALLALPFPSSVILTRQVQEGTARILEACVEVAT